jgi:predicted N-acetyltransferase YhbS
MEIFVNITVRNETEHDYREVENLTREAFWNLYIQGCDEHFLVNKMRSHSDFIKELAFVAIVDGKIAGNIMYTKSGVIDDSGRRIDTITFGPVSVLPEFQRKGIGSALINHSGKIAHEMGHKVIIILGHPYNYIKHGFKVSKDLNISDPQGRYPYGQMVLELEKGALNGFSWKFYHSDVYNIEQDEVDDFDRQFELKNKEYRYTQYEFDAACRAFVD